MNKVLLSLVLPAALSISAGLHAQTSDTSAVVQAKTVAHPGVTALVQNFVLKERLDANGDAVLDESGEPMIDAIPIAEAEVVSGDEVKNLVELVNLGETIDQMDISFDIHAGAELLPDTISASSEATFGYSIGGNHSDITALFTGTESQEDLPDAFESIPEDIPVRLHVSIPEIEEKAQFVFTYNLRVR
ncbi:MAG: hypothetical protein ABJN42_19930 [Roseibium sp.]|uniref:hypothetical protein n=1 Tax=Roseibium sp. TaxID=1936156 RepID=UPI003296A1F8